MPKSKRKIDYADFQTLLIGLAFIAFIIGIGVGIIAEQNTINNSHLGINYTAEFYAMCFQQGANHNSTITVQPYNKSALPMEIPSCETENIDTNVWIDMMNISSKYNSSAIYVSISVQRHSKGINFYPWGTGTDLILANGNQT